MYLWKRCIHPTERQSCYFTERSLKSRDADITKVFPKSGGDPGVLIPVLTPVHCTSPSPRIDGGRWGHRICTLHPTSVSLIHFPGPPIGHPSIFYLCLSESRSIGLGLPISHAGCVARFWNHTSSDYPHLFNWNSDPHHPVFLGGVL